MALPRLIRLFLDAKGVAAYDRLREAPAARGRARQPGAAPRDDRETAATVRAALEAAERELDRFEADGSATPRERLIREAMSVHRSKQKALAELSDEDRARLMLLAQAVLGAKPPGR